MTDNESGLSDGGLQWMIEKLTGVGVFFSDVPAYPVKPDPAGTAHKRWVHPPWTFPGIPLGARKFPGGMPEDLSIAARVAPGNVVAESGENPPPYRPTNRP